jgi:LmbE family N-acetylglucosaminyl deacetylase
MRWIYLSPHLDDASLSAGGLIYEQTQAGIPVEIWTFLCGYPTRKELSPFAELLHSSWGTTSARKTIQVRRAENNASAKILGAKPVYFDFLDCIYRYDKNGKWLYADIFHPIHPADKALSKDIAQAIAKRLKPDDVLVCQFALGGHVDHVIVRKAAESLKRPLFYLADIPYLFNYPKSLQSNKAGMKAKAHQVSKASLKAWQDSIAAYSSQIGMLFESEKHMKRSITEYCQKNNGIRLWTKNPVAKLK